MSDNNQVNVTLISDQHDVIESLSADTKSQFDLTVAKSIDGLDSDNPTNIIIYDLDAVENNAKKAIKDVVKIKKLDPTKVFIIIGDKEPLSEILKSHIQPAIYRAFNKPISANQIILSFKSGMDLNRELTEKQDQGIDISLVGPEGNYSDLESIGTEKNNKPVIIGLACVALIAAVIFFFSSGGEPERQEFNVTNITPTDVETIDSSSSNSSNSLITELNQLAEVAILENRLVSPKDENALHYYNQVLAIDPYDITAYDGKRLVSDKLRNNFESLIDSKDFDKALDVMNTLTKIDPLNIKNEVMHDDLQKAISSHITKVKATGNNADIDKTAKVLKKIEGEFTESKTAITALKTQKDLLAKIDIALTSDNLTPPKKDNAYALISKALRDNKVSKEKLDPKIKILATKLIKSATGMANNDDLEGANKLAALTKKLNSNKADLDKLTALIKSKTPDAEKEKAVAAKPVVAKIIPAKVISRASPAYPKKALQKKIEGWVDLGFTIDTKGNVKDIIVNNSANEIFNKAAIKSLKKWKFSPARNDQTGLPVESKIRSVKLSFKLG